MKKSIIYSSLAALLITACSNEELVPMVDQPVEGDEITITVGMPVDNDHSRVSYVDQAKANLTWEAGDKLVVTGYKADGTYVGKSDFTIQTDLPAKSATANFTGILPTGAGITQYEVYYGASKLTVADKNKGEATINYSGQTQTEAGSTAHLRDYLFLQTPASIPAESFPSAKLTLAMKNAIMKFDIKKMKAGMGTLQSITWENINATSAPSVSLAISGNTWTDAGTAYVCFDPNAMQLHKNGTFMVTLKGTDFTYTLSEPSAAGKTYLTGKRYRVNITTEASTEVGTLTRWSPVIPDNEVWIKVTANNVKPTIYATDYTVSDKVNAEGFWTVKKNEGTYVEELGYFMPETVTSIVFPNSLKTIESSRIASCTALTSVTLPRALESIGIRAFERCTSLPCLTLPAGLKNIGKRAFEKCTSLSSVTFSADVNNLTSLGLLVFYDCPKLKEFKSPAGSTRLLIYNGILKKYAYEGDTAGEVTVPSTVKIIETYAFVASTVKKVTLPEGLTEIQEQAFASCTNSGFTELVIPASVTKLGEEILAGCKLMQKVTVNTPAEKATDFHDRTFASLPPNQVALVLEPSWLTAPDGKRPIGKSWTGNTAWKSIQDTSGKQFNNGQLPNVNPDDGIPY